MLNQKSRGRDDCGVKRMSCRPNLIIDDESQRFQSYKFTLNLKTAIIQS